MGKKIFWILGGASGVAFLVLLGIRMELFKGVSSEESIGAPEFKTGFESAGKDTWMDIFLDRRKIGYSRRILQKHQTGYTFKDLSYLKLNLMGMPGELFMETTGRLHPDYSLSFFEFNLSSGSLVFSASGRVKNHRLEIKTNDQKIQLALEKPVFLPGAIMNTLKAMELIPGKSMEFEVLDPLVSGKQKVLVRLEGKETLEILGKATQTQKIYMTYKGMVQNAWMDENGEVVQETGPMGLRLVKTTKNGALSGFTVASMEDLTRSVSIVSNKILTRPEDLDSLRIRLLNLPAGFQLNGGRQTLKDGILTIIKENPEAADRDPEANTFLEPSPNVQSDHPDIQNLAFKLTSGALSDLEKAKILVHWVYENIEKKPVISIPDALTTLKTRKGDCNEHAALLAAMARAAGIPAQMETGLVYLKGRFFYHAWNSLYLGAWVTADSALGQFPADATHIRLIQGGLESQLHLARLIGTLQLEILND
jgi:hypothetical protein